MVRKVKSIFSQLFRLGYYVVAVYGLFLVLFWLFDVAPPIVFLENGVSKSQVKPGETVIFTQSLVKDRLCFGEVSRWLEGDCGYKIISENNAVLPKGQHTVSIPVTIPDNFLLGSCKFVSRFYYICNPFDWIFHRKIYYAETINFEVVK